MRFYHPQPRATRPIITISGGRASTQTHVKRNLYAYQSFKIPQQVAVCVRRKRRKEVLFASGKAGRKNHTKHVRRNPSSSISCK